MVAGKGWGRWWWGKGGEGQGENQAVCMGRINGGEGGMRVGQGGGE